jgi:hypothetical protein
MPTQDANFRLAGEQGGILGSQAPELQVPGSHNTPGVGRTGLGDLPVLQVGWTLSGWREPGPASPSGMGSGEGTEDPSSHQATCLPNRSSLVVATGRQVPDQVEPVQNVCRPLNK